MPDASQQASAGQGYLARRSYASGIARSRARLTVREAAVIRHRTATREAGAARIGDNRADIEER